MKRAPAERKAGPAASLRRKRASERPTERDAGRASESFANRDVGEGTLGPLAEEAGRAHGPLANWKAEGVNWPLASERGGSAQ